MIVCLKLYWFLFFLVIGFNVLIGLLWRDFLYVFLFLYLCYLYNYFWFIIFFDDGNNGIIYSIGIMVRMYVIFGYGKLNVSWLIICVVFYYWLLLYYF